MNSKHQETSDVSGVAGPSTATPAPAKSRSKKRKAQVLLDAPKSDAQTNPVQPANTSNSAEQGENVIPKASSSKPPPPKRQKIHKLDPMRPFPQVPRGSNATGPYSQRGEGKNAIGVTRKLELGAYLRRCVDLIHDDGYRTLHLSAMGAAIPHALLLSTSLPAALAPTFNSSDIKISTTTGTVQCIDEVIPDEEDEDEDEGGMQIRNKACLNIDIVIGDGERAQGVANPKAKRTKARKRQPTSGK